MNNTALATFGQAISAPLYQQVIDWFRDKHDIIITCDYEGYLGNVEDKDYRFMCTLWGDWDAEDDNRKLKYYPALDDGILEALKAI